MKKLARPFGFIVVACLVYLTALSIFGVWNYVHEKSKLMQDVDARLYNSVVSLKYMLPPDLHDRAVDPQAISIEEDMGFVRGLNAFVRGANLKYVYTIIKKEGKLYFIAGNNDDCDEARGTYYFLEYADADEIFYEAFERPTPLYKSVSDKWGDFRTAIVLETSPGGVKYLACADYEITYVRGLLQKNLVRSIGIALFFVLLGVPVLLFYLSLRSEYFKDVEESEEYLKTALNSIGDAVITTDLNGDVMRMNPVAEKLTGWTATAAYGKPLEEIFSIVNAMTRKPIDTPVKKVINTGKIVGLARHTILLAKGGLEYRVADSAAPIRNREGAIAGVVLVFRDVTEDYALQEQLRQSEKLNAIGQLAGGVAHDFNNMLGGILGCTELLQAKLPDDEKTKEYFSIIIEAAERASDLATKLLLFSRRQATSSTPVDVHNIIRESVSLLRNTIDKSVQIEVDLAAEASMVVGDDSQLQNVFLNLGINSSHAMPGGGLLTYSSKLVNLLEEDCRSSVFDLSPGPYVDIEVRDNGSGISPEHLSRIFEPFFTTKEQGKGTGLGLSAAYGTVQQHNGAITVYSELGKGTSFRLLFPLTEKTAAAIPPSAPPVHGEGLVLLVDDEAVMRAAGKALLSDLGYHVIVAENGKLALSVFRERAEGIDLVILDMIMPEMNGRDCFTALKEICPDIPIVLSSGFTRNEDLADLKDLGLDGFIQKPFRATELSRVVAAALAGRND